FDGLHSKVAVIDEMAVIGSANLSENAGVNTCEASLFTDDPQVVALALGFIDKVKNEADPITEDFLTRIESLPVIRAGGIPRKNTQRITVSRSRGWSLARRDL